MILVVPAVVSGIFGFLAFRSRIKGVYFSILSQALTYAACLMFFRNDFTFGGNNGLTDFKFILGTPEVEASDIPHPAALAGRLKQGGDPVSQYLWSQFSVTNRSRIEELLGKGSEPVLASELGEDLTKVLASGAVYDEKRFQGVTLSPETKSALAASPKDAALMQLNRRLVEEFYAGEIAHKSFTGFIVNSAGTKRALYIASGVLLLLAYLFCRWLTSTRFGLIQKAVRDSENRVLFSGYATANFKLFVFVTAAVLASLGGALFVPQVGIINPSEMGADKSIEAVIWVSVGGRGNLLGPILGAIGINSLKSYATHSFAEQWPYILGGLFIFVTLFMPQGIVGLPAQLSALAAKWNRRTPREPDVKAAPTTALETTAKE
jgi:ABC-type branched-subunit amino acid transport system permease subunit